MAARQAMTALCIFVSQNYENMFYNTTFCSKKMTFFPVIPLRKCHSPFLHNRHIFVQFLLPPHYFGVILPLKADETSGF